MSWTSEQLANHPKLASLVGIGRGHKKATDEQLAAAYSETESIWAVAGRFGMCGQSVHERLTRLGLIQSNAFTPDTKAKIIKFYLAGFKAGELDSFCKRNGLVKTSVVRWAADNNLPTIANREKSTAVVAAMSKRQKQYIATNGHPRGMLGKKHSAKTLAVVGLAASKKWARMTPAQKTERLMKIAKSRERNGTLYSHRPGSSWKSGWRTIGGKPKFYRSRWEANYARYLEFQKVQGLISDWVHESETFWFEGVRRGCVSYLPDFKVTNNDGTLEFHEVKGWMDARSKTKIRRMAKYHPEVKLIIRDSAWFKANKNLKGIIRDWE